MRWSYTSRPVTGPTVAPARFCARRDAGRDLPTDDLPPVPDSQTSLDIELYVAREVIRLHVVTCGPSSTAPTVG